MLLFMYNQPSITGSPILELKILYTEDQNKGLNTVHFVVILQLLEFTRNILTSSKSSLLRD